MKATCAILAGLALVQMQSVRAGWTGFVNGAGYGWAYVAMTSALNYSNSKYSSGFYPGTSIPNDAPPFASYQSYAYGAGYAGGYMQGAAIGYYGDGADNPAFGNVTIIPGPCATLTSDIFFTPGTFPHPYVDPHDPKNPNDDEQKDGIDYDPVTKSGTISVKSIGNAGTGLKLEGWRIPDGLNPEDLSPHLDPQTQPPVPFPFPKVIDGVTYQTVEEFLAVYADWLKAKGATQVFHSLTIGKHDSASDGKCPLIIHYTIDDPNKLLIKSDGIALSAPLEVTFPANRTVECGQTITYDDDDVIVSGVCAANASDLFAKYSPAPDALVLGLNTITVSLVENTNDDPPQENIIRTGSFVINIVDTTKPVITLLGSATVTVGCQGGYIEAGATASDSCAGDLTSQIVKTGTVDVNTPGTYLVKYNVSDGINAAVEVVRTVNVVGLTLLGFHSPIGTKDNAFNNPVTRNLGSTLPIKFDLKCGNSFITGGTPPVIRVQRMKSDTEIWPNTSHVDLPAEYQNDWHNNFPTGQVGAKKNEVYKVTVFAPGGTTTPLAHVFIKFN